MKESRIREWVKNIVAQGGILVFFIMAFEVMIMISPFAFFFYSVFNPVFHWLNAYPTTRWLTHFFLPHMILPPTLPLKIVRIAGSVFFIVGSLTFLICALQVYLGKIFKWGIATQGLYRYIRHPQYAALGVWGMGMAILWPRFIVLATLSLMFILYYFLARDEERRMLHLYGDSYREYMKKTGMFLPHLRKGKRRQYSSISLSLRFKRLALIIALPIIVIGLGFLLRTLTLHSLPLTTQSNITLVPIMPEDSQKEQIILHAVLSNQPQFLQRGKTYLGYTMPVDYIMQGMIANTGAQHKLYKQHHTFRLIMDWVLHPFSHLRRSPAAQMAKAKNMNPALARRHHCPLKINDANMECRNCDFRRVIFVEVHTSPGAPMKGKDVFSLKATKIPAGFIDINTRTGEIINAQQVPPKNAWGDVPTPEI